MSGDHTPFDPGEHPTKVERHVILPYVPTTVMDARRRLGDDLRSLGVAEECIDDAALIISELVSNALRHASPLPTPANPANSVGVAWRAETDASGPGGWLEISVRDGGSTTMPRVADPGTAGLGGRGLGIVQHLAGRWGTEMDATTTTVWAVLDLPAEDVGRAGREAGAEAGTAAPSAGTTGRARDPRAGGPVVSLPFTVHDGGRARGALL
ncbi:ATP-binding protein [Nocardiopsis changdeensis]|uniref:ATP-binding protein n=1 Tax=Nocardiopsis changdeensis TaxID=2831969 RepID=A0ABX8BMR8_9ACTN|nr:MULTISPECIES: ATP-binding protein [Nocardiopsis]QUX22878.1 ATP-binding protein [Nocardiopsis changdeensis]QYX38820.1 ATP-binding protein [Nocardiopsis sp. MT53]